MTERRRLRRRDKYISQSPYSYTPNAIFDYNFGNNFKLVPPRNALYCINGNGVIKARDKE